MPMNDAAKRCFQLLAFGGFALLQFLLIIGGWRYYTDVLAAMASPGVQRLLSSRLFSYLGVVVALLSLLLPFYMQYAGRQGHSPAR